MGVGHIEERPEASLDVTADAYFFAGTVFVVELAVEVVATVAVGDTEVAVNVVSAGSVLVSVVDETTVEDSVDDAAGTDSVDVVEISVLVEVCSSG